MAYEVIKTAFRDYIGVYNTYYFLKKEPDDKFIIFENVLEFKVNFLINRSPCLDYIIEISNVVKTVLTEFKHDGTIFDFKISVPQEHHGRFYVDIYLNNISPPIKLVFTKMYWTAAKWDYEWECIRNGEPKRIWESE